MSYCRFSEGDVYVFESAGTGMLTCCSCFLDDDFWTGKRSEMIAHLERHRQAGHATGSAIDRLLKEMDTEGDDVRKS